MWKHVGDVAIEIMAITITFFIRLYVKIRHPLLWKERLHEICVKMGKMKRFQKENGEKMVFATKYTYGNDTYNDYCKILQLLCHFSSGGWIVKDGSGTYCAICKDDVQKCGGRGQ